jgi:hypothetical protein
MDLIAGEAICGLALDGRLGVAYNRRSRCGAALFAREENE